RRAGSRWSASTHSQAVRTSVATSGSPSNSPSRGEAPAGGAGRVTMISRSQGRRGAGGRVGTRSPAPGAASSARPPFGWSQEALAAAAAIQPPTLSDYERGKKEPSAATLYRLTGCLGLSRGWVDDLLALLAEAGAPPALQRRATTRPARAGGPARPPR